MQWLGSPLDHSILYFMKKMVVIFDQCALCFIVQTFSQKQIPTWREKAHSRERYGSMTHCIGTCCGVMWLVGWWVGVVESGDSLRLIRTQARRFRPHTYTPTYMYIHTRKLHTVVAAWTPRFIKGWRMAWSWRSSAVQAWGTQTPPRSWERAQ